MINLKPFLSYNSLQPAEPEAAMIPSASVIRFAYSIIGFAISSGTS